MLELPTGRTVRTAYLASETSISVDTRAIITANGGIKRTIHAFINILRTIHSMITVIATAIVVHRMVLAGTVTLAMSTRQIVTSRTTVNLARMQLRLASSTSKSTRTNAFEIFHFIRTVSTLGKK